jgi:hypothetical protein
VAAFTFEGTIMLTRKLALFAAASLFCAGLAVAQSPDNTTQPPMMQQHHRDFASLHKSMCEDHQARSAAKLAYVEVKLGLTDAQKPLFAKWRQAVLDSAAKQKTACLAETPKGDMKQPTILERESHEEGLLQAKLDMLKSTRPTLQSFYDSLTDAQKEEFNHLHEHGMHGHPEMGGDKDEHAFMHHPQ